TARGQTASGLLQKFFTTGVSSFDPFAEGPFGFAYYVASFCENGNLLSQWRAYGGAGAGFALGSSSEPIVKVSELLVEGAPTAVLHRIEYERENQRRLVEFVVDRCAELLVADLGVAKSDFERDVLMSGWFALLAVHLTGLFPQFKHP